MEVSKKGEHDCAVTGCIIKNYNLTTQLQLRFLSKQKKPITCYYCTTQIKIEN